jgi:AcrR family transcriptional regulator
MVMVDSVNTLADVPDDAPLGRRLVAVALDELATTTAEKLSIRKVADRLGVSHQAPYVHFGDRRTFLAAVAGVGLAAAAERAKVAVGAAGPEPVARLHALADAYVDFVRSEPHLHDLAYGPAVAMGDHPWLQAAAIEYWNLLVDVVTACQPPAVTHGEVLNRCTSAWGLVYGITRLDIHHKIPPSVPGDPALLLHTTLDALYQRWQASA